jgi:hypothetical protein
MRNRIAALVACGALAAPVARAYPLDLYQETGIHRLEAYHLAREILLERGTLPPGAFRTSEQVKLRMPGSQFEIPAPDPEFSTRVRELLGAEAGAYGVAVLDLTEPGAPRYAEVNGHQVQNPGSVGKIVVLLAWFQALADLYPDDVEARRRVLHDSIVTANDFIERDSHEVPFWKPGDPKVVWRPIELGDSGNLWTWLDWMASASSNAAASMVMWHLVLLRHFGSEYPVSEARAAAYLSQTPTHELQAIFSKAILDPLARNGLDLGRLRQGSFFTQVGKQRIPGTSSLATARELAHYMLRLEEGRLVDSWSSLEIKRLLYLTDKRVRYASQPALDDSAVYYKSGSLYSCKPEPGFECKKYHGNRLNFLNSVAIVETETDGRMLHYIVSVLSNVLRKDSAEVHRELAGNIHQLILADHGARPASTAALGGSE